MSLRRKISFAAGLVLFSCTWFLLGGSPRTHADASTVKAMDVYTQSLIDQIKAKEVGASADANALDHRQSSKFSTPLAGTFSDGFRAGYKAAYPLGLCPIPPIPPIGKDTYGHGYGIGYARGVRDKG